MANYKILVKKHYRKEAKEKQLSLSCTMADLNTRRLEMENIISHLKDGERCLEVGCGNGVASIVISKKKKIDLTCIDFFPEMIVLAKKQPVKGIKGKIRFERQDILEFKTKNYFDTVFTERCVINLLKWSEQKKALKNMAAALKKGGKLILLEAFSDGLGELNRARQEVGLEKIKPAYHNLHLDKKSVVGYLAEEGLEFIAENNFLSSYYFGSRVIYPAIAKANNKEIKYNSSFVNFFSFLPPCGNYSHIKTLVFKKI